MTGKVTNIIRKTAERKGGYFFVHDSEDRDRFAHARDLRGTKFDDLRENDQVEFEPIERQGGKGNGLGAEKVRVVAR